MFRYFIALLSFQLLWLFLPLESIVKQGLTNLVDVNPGQEMLIKIQLTNFYDESQRYALTLCDYAYRADGEVSYLPPGQLPRSNARWIQLYTHSLTVPPKGESHLFYDIKVPRDKSLVGSYWSVILIEPQGQQPIQNSIAEGINLIVKVRYAYQIVTTIPGGISKLQVQNQCVCDLDLKRCLCIDVKNTGNLFLNPTACLKLYNEEGHLVHTLQGPSQKILPDCSVRYYFDLHSTQAGSYSALLFLDSKQKNIFCYRLKVAI